MSFVFNIDADTPGLDVLLASLDKTNLSLAKSDKGLKVLEEGTRRAGHAAKETGDLFDRAIEKGLDPFLHKAEQIAEFEFIREGIEELIRFPAELAEKIVDLGEDAIMTAAKTERMGRAFENALGHDVGKEAFEYFDAIADKTEYTHEQIRGIGLELSKSGFKGEGLKNATAAIADLGSMTENPVQGAEMALSALQRIQATGRLEARALVPFGIQKGEFEKELSEETGLGLKAMRKEMEAGKIPTETVLNSLFKTITNKTGEDLGGVGTAMTDTLTSRLAHLKEKPDLFFEGAKDGRGYKELSDFVAELGEALDPNSAVGKILSGALETAFDELGATLSSVNIDEVFTEVGDVIKELPDNLKAAGAFVRDDLVPAARDAWEIFKDIVDLVKTTATGIGVAKDAIHDYTPIGGLSDLGKKAGADPDQILADLAAKGDLPSQGAVGGALAHIPGFKFIEDQLLNPEFLGTRIKAFAGFGANDVKGYAAGIEGATSAATKAMATMADATTTALKDAHEQHSPSELFRRIAGLDVEGYAQGIEDGGRRLSAAMDDTFVPPAGAPATTASSGPLSVVIEQILVQVEGGGDAMEHGRLAVRGIEEELEPALIRLLERVAKRQGS